MKVGEKIKQRRMELGWSLRELAKRMGYANQSTISRIESGAIDLPQSKVVKFADVLGTSVAYLMDWEEVQQKNDTLSDIVIRLQTDERFFAVVEAIHKSDGKKLSGILNLLD